MTQSTPALRWTGHSLQLLDQRRLPAELCYVELRSAPAVAEAIRDMVVRGAPAIGIAAAYGAALAARGAPALAAAAAWSAALEPALAVLAAARPTAVNLFWALARVRQEIAAGGADLPARLERLACRIHAGDIADNRRIGAFGAALLPAAARVLTHCNAGALATGGYGTALGVVRAAHAQGRLRQVYASETRPWLQGARLTAWELAREDIPVLITTEAAVGGLMRSGAVDWVVVGADRVARNGDVANKVGTYNLAVLARHHGVRFMVALPTSTIDLDCADGGAIPIEQRAPEEVTQFMGRPIAPAGVGAINPSFDITPAALVDVLVTEKGAVARPDAQSVARLLR